MNIKKINIENFKCFNGKFTLDLNSGINIIVGNNEAGKSTILEAIHLALTGILNGRYIHNELSQYLFNNSVIKKYIRTINHGRKTSLPYILIEIFFDGEIPILEGNGNKDKEPGPGIFLKIEFDESYKPEYEKLIEGKALDTIPIEYYKIVWKSFARQTITPRSIPVKSVLIDSSSYRYQNGSDIYISRIIKNNLDDKQKADISQTFRRLKETFKETESVKAINKQIKECSDITKKEIKISVDLSTQNAWETTLMTYLDEVPFHQIGKGEQCIVKTNLALGHKKSEEANLILLEEPENHLSHTRLNEFIQSIAESCADKQVIISTHNSFVANKLGLENLIFLNEQKQIRLSGLESDTQNFFKKLSGYDTLRLILCDKAILVEGDSDELIVQKAFMEKNDGKLPIECGIDVISVKLTFKRFLQIAEKIDKKVAVVTDNDGDIEGFRKKYQYYLEDNKKDNIEIYYDHTIDDGELMIGKKKFNYNTLEPKFLKVNSVETFNDIFETTYANENDMHMYMKSNKTECALKVFESDRKVNYPQYINEVINWCDE